MRGDPLRTHDVGEELLHRVNVQVQPLLGDAQVLHRGLSTGRHRCRGPRGEIRSAEPLVLQVRRYCRSQSLAIAPGIIIIIIMKPEDGEAQLESHCL